MYSDTEKDDRLSKESDQQFHRHFHVLVLLFCEEDGLGEVYAVEVAEMFVMVVVSISPVIEREMHIHSDNLTDDPVEADWGEKWEMGHVVELDEQTHDVESMEGPS